MPFRGIIWATIISIPFWLTIIVLIKTGILAAEILIFVGLILSGLLLFLIFASPQKTKQDELDKQFFSAAAKGRYMYNVDKELKMTDNGGTRSGTDRRKFQYTAYIPERRSSKDRRKEFDRRSRITRRRGSERRFSLNHRGLYPIERRDMFRTQA